MNAEYLFTAVTYRADAKQPGVEPEYRVGQLGASGSQETRARRRVLNHLNAAGWCVKSITVDAMREVPRDEN